MVDPVTATEWPPVYFMPKPRTRDGRECFAYQWIGQSLKFCDNCGQPFWEHTHVRVQHPSRRFGYSLHRVIGASAREAVRRKWDH